MTMLAAPAIPDTFIEPLMEATQQVFATMARMTLTSGTPLVGDALRPLSNVVGTVSFAGPKRGVIALYSTSAAAAAVTEAMLGVPVGTREEIADAVGELTNIIAGTFRNHMARDGAAWAISIPTVTIGSDFYTKHVADAGRVLCPMKCEEHEFFVELILSRH